MLAFIVDQYPNNIDPGTYRNGVLKPTQRDNAPRAHTFLLFPHDFPPEFVFLASFKGPIVDPQFIFSTYSANNKMHFGIKVTRFSAEFVFDESVDGAINIRRSKFFSHDFQEKAWYMLGVLVLKNEIRVAVNCEEIGRAYPDHHILKDFDIFGLMFIGADVEEKEARTFKVRH